MQGSFPAKIAICIAGLRPIRLLGCGSNRKDGVSGAELFDSLRFVQLETTPESMFDYVRCLKLLNGKFYLLDRMGTKLLCFDRDGKFLKKFEARGNGPDEYFMLCFLAADPVSKKILVADDVVRKIFIFDEFLNLEHVVKVDFTPKQVIAFRDDMILRYENDNKEQYQDSLLRDYDLHWIDLKGDVVQGMIKEPDAKIRFVVPVGQRLFGQRGYSILSYLGDTVYRVAVSERTVSPAYIIESGDEDVKLLNDEQRREMDPNAELPEYEKLKLFFPVEFFNVGSHILLRSGWTICTFIRKNSGNAIRYDKTLENMSGDHFDYLTSIIYACDGDWCFGPHHAITLQYMAKDYGFSGKYKAMIDSMETDANLFWHVLR